MHPVICFDIPTHAFSSGSYLISGLRRHLSNNINNVPLSLQQGSIIHSYSVYNPAMVSVLPGTHLLSLKTRITGDSRSLPGRAEKLAALRTLQDWISDCCSVVSALNISRYPHVMWNRDNPGGQRSDREFNHTAS